MASGKPVARVVSIVVVGLLAAAVFWFIRSPMDISEVEARRLVSSHELIGLGPEEAGQRLQHNVSPIQEGTLVLDFKQVKGWKAGPLTLDIREGKVSAATWGEPAR